MTEPRQLPLPLPVRTALGREDYFVGPANALAVALIEGWQSWPARKFLLLGPEGAGKTHLARVWAAQSGASIAEAVSLSQTDIPELARGPVCVENAHRVAGDPQAQTNLFHLHNLVLAEGHSLLLTAVNKPSRWGLTLADLQSRLEGTQSADLPEPDDALLTAVLAKLFTDRQIVPAKDVIAYLVANMPRRYADAQRIAEALDLAALTRKGRITRPLARDVLGQMGLLGPAS